MGKYFWLIMINDPKYMGKTFYYHDDGSYHIAGKIRKGKVVKTTKKFCTMMDDYGVTKRKSKHLLFKSEDEVKLIIVKKVNSFIFEQFGTDIYELVKLSEEMIDKYPEKFV